MSTVFIIILSIIIAGIEPFLPVESLVVAWSGVVGTRRSDWTGIAAVLVAGLIRDIVLVERLGVSALVALTVWLVVAVGTSRLGRPLVVAVIGVLAGVAILAEIEHGHLTLWDLGVSALSTGLTVFVWSGLADRGGGIRLRDTL